MQSITRVPGAVNRERRMNEEDFAGWRTCSHLRRQAEHAVTALDETNLRIGRGDFIALVGPSGCGKSTILKLVGGLIPVSRGLRLRRGGAKLGAEPIRIGMAFQNPPCCRWLENPRQRHAALKIVPPFRQEYRARKHTEFKDRAEHCSRRSA